MKELITPDDPRWHDKTFQSSRPFECEFCGAEGTAAEADPRCEECGRINQLAFEIER